MRHLTVAAAVLFLFAAPGLSLAQNNDSGSSSGANSGGDNSGGGTAADGDSNCNDVTPDQKYESFNEKCRKEIDTFAMGQTGASVKYEGDVAVGTVLPDTVEIIEVPAYKNYGYVYLNDKRVLVNRDNRTIVRVY